MMGYYQGDWYAGTRGDPGIGSFFGSLASSALSLIPGVGPLASKAVSALGARTTGAAATGGIGKVITAGRGIIMKHPVLSGAGAAGAIGVGLGAELRHHRKCKHINPRTGKCRRRMNVCNPRALRRSIRRTHGFAKLAMRTIHLVHPKKKVRFGGFKKKRGRK